MEIARLFDNPIYLAFRERFYEGIRKAGMPEECRVDMAAFRLQASSSTVASPTLLERDRPGVGDVRSGTQRRFEALHYSVGRYGYTGLAAL
jgi:hypothetical protein